MTTLTEKEIKKQYAVKGDAIDKYFKNHPKIVRTPKTVKRVRERIRAARIARAPGKEVSFTQSAAEWQIIYGRVKVGGVFTFVAVSGPNNNGLHVVITLAGHQINSIEKVYLDDEEVIFGASPDPRWSTSIRRLDGTLAPAYNKIFLSQQTLGAVGQAANADLVGQLPTLWNTDHTQDGCAHAYMIFVWDATLFPNGLPEITFIVQGKPVKLPGGSTTYSNIGPACIRDYMTDTRYGMAIPEAQIDATVYSDNYDIANQDVTILPNYLGATTEKRYTVDGVFKSSDSPQEVLEAMCAACGGTVTYINGKWKIYVGAYHVPTLTLTEDDILSDIRVQTKFSRKDSFNGVRGTFVSPADDFEETDFPVVKNDFYMSLDNNERVWEDIQLPCTTSPARAQRLAKMELERNRQSITVQFTASLKAYQLEPLNTFYLTISRMGWSSKIFEVQQLTLNTDDSQGDGAPAITVELLVRETAAAIYEWASGQETAYDIAPNTNLPNPLSVPTITGLVLESGTDHLYIRKDGTVFSRIYVSWDSLDDFFVTSGGAIEIQYKQTAAVDFTPIGSIVGESTAMYILDVQDTISYTVRVRALNALGIPGAWNTQAHVVVGKTEPPSDVPSLAGEIGAFGTRLYWPKVSDLDVNTYEIRIGAVGATWEDSELVARVSANSYTSSIQIANTYQFLIKALDTSGNYSLAATPLISDIQGPAAPVTMISIQSANYTLSWLVPDSQFSIDEYEIAYGDLEDAYEDRTVIATTKGTRFQAEVDWGGGRAFWVTAIDVAGNYGTPYQVSAQIDTPSTAQSLTSQVLDQNVLLRWTEPTTHTLPIERYDIYKGDVFSSATFIGERPGTFAALFEILGGNYSYWVVPVDTAGNEGPEIGISVIIADPTDFVLIETGDPEFLTPFINPDTATAGVRYTADEETLILPVNDGESWADHFISNGWTNIQDAIDDGALYFIQPVPDNGYWQRDLDYGSVVDSALVTMDFNRVDYDGTTDLHVYTASSLDGITYSTLVEGQQALYTNFQFIRIRIQVGEIGALSGGMAMGNIGLTYP